MTLPVSPENSAREGQVAVARGDSESQNTVLKPLTTLNLIKKMRLVLSRRLVDMEKNPMEDGLREANLLSTASRTLDKLIAMEQSRKPTPRARAASREMMELRNKIAARIEQLNQG